MLTFTSDVGKLNVRVLWHHHMLLQVISQSYCQVFVKSYNLVFEKIDKEGSPPVKSDQNKAISVHVLWVPYPSTTEVPPCCQAATKKVTFSTTSVLLLLNVPLSLSRGTVFRRQKNPRRGYRPKIAGILFICMIFYGPTVPEINYSSSSSSSSVMNRKVNTIPSPSANHNRCHYWCVSKHQMAPWCIYTERRHHAGVCIERLARSASCRQSVGLHGVVGTMNAARSRPDCLATVQSGRKQGQSRVCSPSMTWFGHNRYNLVSNAFSEWCWKKKERVPHDATHW